jgi:hypothetical protein
MIACAMIFPLLNWLETLSQISAVSQCAVFEIHHAPVCRYGLATSSKLPTMIPLRV